MLFRLLLLFITVPLVELVLLLYLAEVTDWKFALGLVIVTGIAGSLLAKSQGLRAYRRIQQELAEGRVPGEALIDALMIFVAGALLLAPGILTDLVGLTLLIPAGRRFYRREAVRRFKTRFVIQRTSEDGWQVHPGSEIIDSYVVDKPPPPDERLPDPDR